MNIWNKILIGCICVAALGFFYLAMRALKTHQYWRQIAQRAETRIEELESDNHQLIEGTGEGGDNKRGIVRLRVELHKMLIDRGRVWYNCQPKPVPQTGQVVVTADLPDPHGITDKTILCAFEEADVNPSNLAQGGRYIGEFRVFEVDDQQVSLEPSMKIKPGTREFQRLVGSKGPWTLYEIMPIDGHDIFAGLSKDALGSLLPEASLTEFAKDGQKATPDDLEEWGVRGRVVDENGAEVEGNVEGTYVRQLRDYEVLFRAYHLQQTVLSDLWESTTRDKQYMEDAVADAKRQAQFREEEKAQLEKEEAKYTRERDAVAEHRKALETALAAVQAAIVKTIAENRAIAGQIAKIQMDAARRIDARIRTMAQSRAGGTQRTE